MLKERKTAKPSNRKMFASKKAKGLNKIAEIVKKKKKHMNTMGGES